MPIYEFACVECGTSFEEWLRSVSTPEEVRCPQCDSDHVKRKLSTFAAHFGAGASSTGSRSSAGCSTGGT